MYKEVRLSSPYINGHELQNAIDSISFSAYNKCDKYIKAFEERMCGILSVPTCLAVTSGPVAIQLALEALGIGRGDPVIFSDLSLAENCYPALYKKAVPIFVDCKSDDWSMSELALEEALFTLKLNGRLPKAVVVADVYGQSADFKKLFPVCELFGIPIIEDASDSLGAYYCGRPSGTFGELSILTFNKDSLVTAMGGGMLVTDHAEMLESFDLVKKCYCLSDVCAAIGLGQLDSLFDQIEYKKHIFRKYAEAFTDLPIMPMPILKNSEPNCWLSAFLINIQSDVKPNQIIDALRREGAEAGRIYEPLHQHSIFSDVPFFSTQDERNSTFIYNQGFCLPSGFDLTSADQQNIICAVKSVFARRGEA